MHVMLPGIFGLRMCLHCPDCNSDHTDPQVQDQDLNACTDYLGSNAKAMGGYAGLATGAIFAAEYQGEGTPHAHGFVASSLARPR